MLAHLLPFLLFAGSSIAAAEISEWEQTCKTIQEFVSSKSTVFYPGDAGFDEAIEHWGPNAVEISTCAVEAGSVYDVSTITRILSKSTTPYAVKSGGHSSSKGSSSTKGVQISLRRMDEVTFKKDSMVADLGPGGLWLDVFRRLEAHGVSVAGGRIATVGVAGYLLGGGYSWQANRHGLAFDNIVSYELVKPDGHIVEVSEHENQDLYFALKGGYNNFGIVTRFTMKAYEQGPVYGGMTAYSEDQFEPLFEALVKHSEENTDPDCVVVMVLGHTPTDPFAAMCLYYNGPEQKSSCFDDFLAIPTLEKNVTLQRLSDYVELTGAPLVNPSHQRALIQAPRFGRLSLPVVRSFAKEIKTRGLEKPWGNGSSLTAIIEPYIRSAIVRPNASETAWPHNQFVSPSGFVAFWTEEDKDSDALEAIVQAADAVTATAQQSGEDVSQLLYYPNYQLAGTNPIEDIYGSNLPRLRELWAQHDPLRVTSRSGGFKLDKAGSTKGWMSWLRDAAGDSQKILHPEV